MRTHVQRVERWRLWQQLSLAVAPAELGREEAMPLGTLVVRGPQRMILSSVSRSCPRIC